MLEVIREEIRRNYDKSGVRLSACLESHLVETAGRYLCEMPDARSLTMRMVHAADLGETPTVMRKIGDDCLICCGIFPEHLTRHGGSVPHYAGIGRMAYDAAGLIEASHGFGLMLEVLSIFRPDRPLSLLDLAQAGSVAAREKMISESNVTIFRKPVRKF